MSFVGKALWADAAGSTPVVRDAPDWPVGDNEIKIRVHAVALNPADVSILVCISSVRIASRVRFY